MSLKHDIEEYPEFWSKELVAALKDYKNGERNSKRKLRKFVNREISEHYYNELIERHSFSYRVNKAKQDRKRKWRVKKVILGIISFVVLLMSFLCTLKDMVLWYDEIGGFWYIILFFIALWFIGEVNADEVSNLKRENEILKLKLESLERSDAYDE